MPTEAQYQRALIRKLEQRFPGCFVIPMDPETIQGIPDLLVLHMKRWAMLEVKTSEHAPTQPNQPYYVDLFGRMSYCSFIYPRNEEVVFDELQRAFYN